MKRSLSIKSQFLFSFFALLMLGLGGCNKNAETVTPALPGNEFLTTVELVLQNTANPSDVQIARWTQFSPYTHTYQPDSSYVNLAFLNLQANSTYSGQVVILDETQTPVDTVSTEIKARENYHLFFFQPSPIATGNVVISNTTTNIPMTDWNTGMPASDTTAGGSSINRDPEPSRHPAEPYSDKD